MDTEPQSAFEPKPDINSDSKPNKLLLRRIGIFFGLVLIAAGVFMLIVPSENDEAVTQDKMAEEEMPEEEEGMYSEYFSPLPPPSFIEGAKGDAANAIYQRALQAYGEKKYSDAIGLFKQALEAPDFAAESRAQASLYLGISLLETKQALSALQILEPYELHPDYKYDVRWYQAQGFIQLNQRENVIHTLFSIARDPDQPHTLAAQSLLREFVPDAEE